MPWIPDDQQISEWSARLRASLPSWGVYFDPSWRLWVAVRGADKLVMASTPMKLVRRADQANGRLRGLTFQRAAELGK